MKVRVGKLIWKSFNFVAISVNILLFIASGIRYVDYIF